MYGARFLSVLIPALALASPTPQAAGTCTTTSESRLLSWTVHGLEYHASYIYTTPAHQNSDGYFSFNFTNSALPSLVYQCSAVSNMLEDFFFGNVVYPCTQIAGGSNGNASFTYDRPSGTLALNQTWTCDDESGTSQVAFSAHGDVSPTLQCTDNTTTNPDWSDGEIYSDREVKCTPMDLTFKPSSTTWDA